MKRSKAEMERTRLRLLDAAEWVFSDQGYAAANLEEIADTAGLSRGAIYWHFKGKPELLDAVVARAWFPWDQLPIEKSDFDRPPSIQEMAHELGQGVQRTLLEPHLRRSALILLQGRELRNVSERLLLRLRSMQQRVALYVSLVIEQARERIASCCDSSAQAKVVQTFMFGALSEALMLGRPGEQSLVGQEVERFVLELLLPVRLPSKTL
ncbi:TetR family transcriptional regulator [Pseudomonas sp. s4]|uniref:TetR family transcriptional regulator n=1 Tax=Pseudomonas sp. s4 TaxID=353218 RepID=UPI00398D58C9